MNMAAFNQKEDTIENKQRYLTFFLSDEEYGISIENIREIIEVLHITSVPYSPDYLKGVINLRGKVVPIIDLKLKFGLPECVPTEKSCIIVVEYTGEYVGVLVDEVSEVIDVSEDQFDETSFLGQKVEDRFIRGVGKIEGKIKILLDIKNVLAYEKDDSI